MVALAGRREKWEEADTQNPADRFYATRGARRTRWNSGRIDQRVWKVMGIWIHTGTRWSRFSAGENSKA